MLTASARIVSPGSVSQAQNCTYGVAPSSSTASSDSMMARSSAVMPASRSASAASSSSHAASAEDWKSGPVLFSLVMLDPRRLVFPGASPTLGRPPDTTVVGGACVAT